MCVFCKIVEGSIPAYKIYEDSDILAFLDISQVTIGHTLVIPKKHYENIFELDEKTAATLYEKVVGVAKMLKQKLGINDLNILNNNGKLAYQSVGHYHIHLLPRYENDEFKINFPTNKLTDKEFNDLMNKITN
ncbi:MAG: HIT domain-containing protein [Bacilli bacterium]|nr:HIT domain-containing protein [Bacilli bacterium]